MKGAVKSVDISFCFPVFRGSDIRYNFELGARRRGERAYGGVALTPMLFARARARERYR
jgi:hypothetical protein